MTRKEEIGLVGTMMRYAARMRTSLLMCCVLLVAGCVTNPETGRQSFILTSESQESAMGDQAYREILSKERPSSNTRWTQILQRVGRRVAAVANRPDFHWEFRLIGSKEMNAFCLPGGKVAFYTGIFPVARTEAGLAAIMGHEVAHATLRHGGQRITLALGTQLGLMGLQQVLGGGDSTEKSLLFAALGAGATVGAVLPFSRANESEADEIGLVYMARAGYDPREAPGIWARMAQQGGAAPPEFLSTHPPSLKRQKALEAQVPRAMPVYERSPRVGTGETL